MYVAEDRTGTGWKGCYRTFFLLNVSDQSAKLDKNAASPYYSSQSTVAAKRARARSPGLYINSGSKGVCGILLVSSWMVCPIILLM